MNETKVNLSITIPGSVMFSKEECLKTIQKTVEKKYKNGQVIKKFISSTEDNLDMMDKNTIRVTDGKTFETLVYYTRKCKSATQSINITKESYEYMVSKDSCIPSIKVTRWNAMNKKERLEAHLNEIMLSLGGTSFSYKIFED